MMKREEWLFAAVGWDPTWQRRVPRRMKAACSATTTPHCWCYDPSEAYVSWLVVGLGAVAIALGILGFKLCARASKRLSAAGRSATGRFHFGRALTDRRVLGGSLLVLLGQVCLMLALAGTLVVLLGLALLLF
jgi:hypothetical protein